MIYTPVNPTRPFVGRLRRLHRFNVEQNDQKLFDYMEEEVVLHPNLQKEGLWRGQNVIQHFNDFYDQVKHDYEFIGKWDDDIVLMPGIIGRVLKLFEDESLIGVGLFQEDYGAPNILMTDPLHPNSDDKPSGWYGAFSRFYVYRMKVWGRIPVEAPWLHGPQPETVRGEHSGDPDNEFQIRLKGKKHILNEAYIHIDHRALGEKAHETYGLWVDLAYFLLKS